MLVLETRSVNVYNENALNWDSYDGHGGRNEGHMSTQNGTCGRLTMEWAIKTIKGAMILSYLSKQKMQYSNVLRETKNESGLTSNERRMIKGLKVLSS